MNDAESLAQDPTYRLMGSERTWQRGAAQTFLVQSFETELLTQEENLSGLAATTGRSWAKDRSRVKRERRGLTRPGGKAAVSRRRTRFEPDGTVSRSPGPGRREYLCAGVPKGTYSVGLLGAKTGIPA